MNIPAVLPIGGNTAAPLPGAANGGSIRGPDP